MEEPTIALLLTMSLRKVETYLLALHALVAVCTLLLIENQNPKNMEMERNRRIDAEWGIKHQWTNLSLLLFWQSA